MEAVYPLPQELAARAAAGTLAHAYILAGEAGRTEALGLSLSAALVCSGGGARPCGTCRDCRKALGGIHPDVARLAPEEGKDFTVAQARALRADAYVTPNEAERKVYLIQDAQRMNPNAQNALLKVLEEGPRYAAFLLLTDNAEALLPTIRSRCETVRVAGTAEGTQAGGEGAALAEALLGDDPWARLAWCVPHEKDKREDTLELWEGARQALLAQAGGKKRKKAAALAQGLGELAAQLRQNVNPGALWGALYALADQAGGTYTNERT